MSGRVTLATNGFFFDVGGFDLGKKKLSTAINLGSWALPTPATVLYHSPDAAFLALALNCTRANQIRLILPWVSFRRWSGP